MRLLSLFLIALGAHAAVLQGFVLDFESGRALARTSVTLTPLPGWNNLKAQSLRTESNGSFFFGATPGPYLLSLQREGFATFRYGAHCGTCPGVPIYLNGEERTAIDIRMHRLGAITGTVIDENQVGIPGIPLVVYTATRPLQSTGKAITDDRGFFRFGQLSPGNYIIRTVPTRLDDGASYLASFYPEGTDMRYVRQIPVELDRTWTNADFPPVPGTLYRVKGRIFAPFPGIAKIVELVSDSGRQASSVDGGGNFSFENVAPGNYELFSEGKTDLGHFAAWQPLVVERDSEVTATMAYCPSLNVTVMDEARKRLRSNEAKVVLRRKDLDKEGKEIAITAGDNTVAPGNWEIGVVVADYYTREVRIQNKPAEKRAKNSVEGWAWGLIPFMGPPPSNVVSIAIGVSSRVGSITGRALERTNEPAAYAPVLLETMQLDPPDPPLQREARADANGSFQFNGLPPGRYRLLSSFDLDWADRQGLDVARPVEVSLREGEKLSQDVTLYHKP